MSFLIAQQNLVPNSSFENYTICPIDYNNPPPPPWYLNCTKLLKAGYLNACTPDACTSVPYNCVKGYNYQQARTGQAYTFLDYVNGPNNRQYIQTQLKDSLKQSHCYYVEYFVNLPNTVKFACNNNGLLLTKNYFYVDTLQNQYAVYPANPQIINYGNPIITDTLGWQKISSVYVAQGGERFITIGNFKYDSNTILKNVNPIGYHGAGYIIDDVSIYEIDTFKLKADAGVDKTIANGDSAFIGCLTNGITNIVWLDANNNIINTVAPGFYVKPNASTFYIVEQTVCGFTSRDTVYINVILPLTIINYQLLMINEKQVQSRWVTANEINVSHFNIQRSVNGKDFVNVGKVAAKGNGEYSFIDPLGNLELGIGNLYYKIMAVDFDGRKTYTEIKTLNINHSSLNVMVFPNPAKDVVNISCKDMKQLLIIDYLGRTIKQVNNITNQHQTLNTKQLPKGLYLLQIITNKNELKNEKLIIE